jgi:hypothetical protein
MLGLQNSSEPLIVLKAKSTLGINMNTLNGNAAIATQHISLYISSFLQGMSAYAISST